MPKVISSGRFFDVTSHQKVSGLVISGGDVTVDDGGTLLSTKIRAGKLYVERGGRASGISAFGGEVDLYGGVITGITVHSGGSVTVASGTISGATIIGGDIELLGGKLVDAVVSKGGIGIDGGASASGTTILRGAKEIVYEGRAVDTTVSAGGKQMVDTGVVSGTIVNAGGELALFDTTYAYQSEIKSGGTLLINGGHYQGLVDSGATEIIGANNDGAHPYQGIQANGVKLIASGGYLRGTNVSNNGMLLVTSGGGTSNTTIDHASVVIQSGSQLIGLTTFKGDATLTLAGGNNNVPLRFSGFDATDRYDFKSFFSGPPTLFFSEGKGAKFGTLQIKTNFGQVEETIQLFGQYVAAGFHLKNDGAGGYAITYSAPAAASPELAGPAKA